jgi:hypothetical protein
VFDAVYRLTNPQEQIRAYVYDVVRATLPRMDLDEAFEAKDEIAHAIKTSLQASMHDYGYLILSALVTVRACRAFALLALVYLQPALCVCVCVSRCPVSFHFISFSFHPTIEPILCRTLNHKIGPGAGRARQGGHERGASTILRHPFRLAVAKRLSPNPFRT